MKRRQLIVKGLIDVVAAALALILLSPILAVVALLIRVTMGKPVLFRQVRAGLGGRPFVLYKFRTMKEEHDAQGHLLHDSVRLTSLGRLVGHGSLDELPALYNVLRRDMSLVGPRPFFMEYVPRYTQGQARRLEVLPGITGLAQVMGRNGIPFSRRIAYDVHYVDNFSLWLDLKILLTTAVKVLTGVLEDGAGQDVSVVDDIDLYPQDPSIGTRTLEYFHSRQAA